MAVCAVVAFGAFALADWIAVAQGWKRVEYVAKPAALVALVVYAALGPAASPWLLAALVFSLLGDMALMLPADLFVAGLGAFLLAHIAYIIDFDAALVARLIWLAGTLALLSPLAFRLVRSVNDARLRPAVAAYILVIAFMVASALASGNVLAAAGAILFMVSDTLIAWNRFVHRLAWAQPAIMITYHLAQFGLASALRAA